MGSLSEFIWRHDHSVLRRGIDAALAELNPLEQEAILYYHYQGRGWDEVGVLMGLPESAAYQYGCQGLEKLEHALRRFKD
jgi:DNA-directed RNA polymerase specialized sigma24 family protein